MVCHVRVSHWIGPLKFHSRLCSTLLLMERASWRALSELLVAVSVEVCCAKSVLSHRSNTKSLSQRIVSGEKNLKFSFRKVRSRAFNPPYLKIEMWGFVTLLCVGKATETRHWQHHLSNSINRLCSQGKPRCLYTYSMEKSVLCLVLIFTDFVSKARSNDPEIGINEKQQTYNNTCNAVTSITLIWVIYAGWYGSHLGCALGMLLYYIFTTRLLWQKQFTRTILSQYL